MKNVSGRRKRKRTDVCFKDNIMEHSSLLLDSYFNFFFAKAVHVAKNKVFHKICDGCKNGYLSQTDHLCLVKGEETLLTVYFIDILDAVNVNFVIQQWESAVRDLNSSSPGLIELCKLKYTCKDWIYTDKNWQKKIIDTVGRISKLERRFTIEKVRIFLLSSFKVQEYKK